MINKMDMVSENQLYDFTSHIGTIKRKMNYLTGYYIEQIEEEKSESMQQEIAGKFVKESILVIQKEMPADIFRAAIQEINNELSNCADEFGVVDSGVVEYEAK